MAAMNTPDHLPANHLGALARARRRELELTQAELAARIEKSPSYISALESGSVAPSLTTLRHIASALDTVVGFFFERPGESGRSEPGGAGARLRVVRPD